MPRTWPYLTAVAVVGLLAGAAIAGRPVVQDPFVILPGQIPTTLAPGASTDSTSVATVSSTADSTGSTVRVVLVDASGESGVLQSTRDVLDGRGYASVTTAVGGAVAAASTIYYRDGFAQLASTLAADLGLSDAPTVLLTNEVLSPIDDQGDLIVLLGADVGA